MKHRSPTGPAGLLLAALALSGCMEEQHPMAPDAPDVVTLADVTAQALIVVTSTANDGPGSLREAVEIATPGSTIQFAAGLAGATIALSQRLDISIPLTIEGPVTAPVRISGGGVTQHFSLGTGADLTLRNLVLTGGWSGSAGGAIGLFSTAASLTLENSTIMNSHAVGNGGAIGGLGSITLVRSTLSGNRSDAGGGGLWGDSRPIAILNSTLSGNQAGGVGGGILLGANADLSLFNSTVAYNEATAGGGGIAIWPTSSLDRDVVIGSSIVAHNSNGNCQGDPTSTELSISSDGTCGFGGGSGSSDTDPLIGPLEDNGGSTRTHALLPGSPAVDAGRPDCAAFLGSVILLLVDDQRGVARPQGGGCDVGPVEQTAATPAILANATVDSRTGVATLQGTVTCLGPTQVLVRATLQQAQKAGRVNTTVHASGEVVVACSDQAGWTLTLAPTSGAFRNGDATAAVTTDADVSGQAAATLKLRWSR